MLKLRFNIAWLPLFGAGLQISYADTENLAVAEAAALYEMAVNERDREVRAAFKGRGA